jgi:hypothetical protein
MSRHLTCSTFGAPFAQDDSSFYVMDFRLRTLDRRHKGPIVSAALLIFNAALSCFQQSPAQAALAMLKWRLALKPLPAAAEWKATENSPITTSSASAGTWGLPSQQ